MNRIYQPRSVNSRRSRLSVIMLLSMATIGCADVSDSSDDTGLEVDQFEQPLLDSKVVVTPTKGSSTTATVRAVEDEPEAKPTITVSSGPTIVGVTRGVWIGGKKQEPKKEDTKKEDAKKEDTKKEDAKKEDTKKPSDGVTVKQSGGKTIISVPGFPDITLTPDKNSKDGGVIVSVPGMPDFAAPAGSVLEAPGGIKIST